MVDSSIISLPDDVRTFLAPLDGPKRAGCDRLISLMVAATGSPPAMLGSSIIGCGTYDYRYESGREGTSCALGFSPRAKEFSIYLSPHHADGYEAWGDLLAPLGKYRVGKGCLYLKDPLAVPPDALSTLFAASLEALRSSPVVVGLHLGGVRKEKTRKKTWSHPELCNSAWDVKVNVSVRIVVRESAHQARHSYGRWRLVSNRHRQSCWNQATTSNV